jgi:hypothetical protein
MKPWWLDERAHAGQEHLDAGYVAGYDRKAGFDPTEDVEVLRQRDLGPDSLVVDLGRARGPSPWRWRPSVVRSSRWTSRAP